MTFDFELAQYSAHSNQTNLSPAEKNLVPSGAEWGAKAAKAPLVDGGPTVTAEAGGDGNGGQDGEADAQGDDHLNLESAISL